MYAEILDKRAVESDQLVGYSFRCDRSGHIGNRFMDSHESYTQPFGTHYHHGLMTFAETILKIFGVAREVEIIAMDGLLVDRRGNEHVNETVAKV